MAEIGSEFTTGQFAEKNAKMRGVGYFVDWQRLSSYFCFSGASSFSKRYIRVKKSQCLFFTRSLFLSKSMPFWVRKRPFWRAKTCTKHNKCAVSDFLMHPFYDRRAAKNSQSASISRFSIVKKSE